MHPERDFPAHSSESEGHSKSADDQESLKDATEDLPKIKVATSRDKYRNHLWTRIVTVSDIGLLSEHCHKLEDDVEAAMEWLNSDEHDDCPGHEFLFNPKDVGNLGSDFRASDHALSP